MSHGKETPRQKLIGMMYLVLMAMLALNTSKDVLNAFSVLDDGLNKTLHTLATNNDKIIADFGVQFEMNPAKVQPWQDKAAEVKERGDALVELIEEKKKEILLHAGEDLEEIYDHGHFNGKAISGKDITDAPAFVMVGDLNNKGGKEIKNAIIEYRDFLVNNILNKENASELAHTIEKMLDTSDPKPHDEGSHEAHPWEVEHFSHLPMAGVMSIMSGMQINVKNAQSDALKYLYSQIDAGSFKFNRLSATVIPNSNYVIRGNEYNAEVFLAASDTTASPKIYVTADSRPYDSIIADDGSIEYSRREGIKYDSLDVEKGSGKGIFRMPSTSLGEKIWGGLIELTGPSGKIVKPFKQRYLVAEGSVTVAPIKMNVFYLGVDNPVRVSVAGVQPDKIDISVTNARHVKKGGAYIVRPIRPGNAYVVVYANVEGQRREMGREEFRVKTVPNPVAMVNGQKGGAISKGVLSAQLGVIAEMENFDFDLKFTITEFTVSAVVQGFVREYTSKSNKFTPEQKNLIGNLSRGNNVYIQDIKAVGPDGSTRPLSTINFRLN